MSSQDFMQLFLKAARTWVPRIKKATYASEVLVEREQSGAVTFVVRWARTRVRPAGERRITFSRARVLGRTQNSPPIQQRPVKKMCRFRDDVIADVLQARGV